MSQVEAIYEGGVFRPLHTVALPEKQRVRLSIRPIAASDTRAWLAEVREFQQRIITKRGYFPDSTTDIAADRIRDE